MSVLLCAGKLTYPIKESSDKLGITGVSYVESLGDYLEYNNHIEKIIFIETLGNKLNEDSLECFDGDIVVFTRESSKYQKEEEYVAGFSPIPLLTSGTLDKIKGVKPLEGMLVRDIQWEVMCS